MLPERNENTQFLRMKMETTPITFSVAVYVVPLRCNLNKKKYVDKNKKKKNILSLSAAKVKLRKKIHKNKNE